MDILMYNSWKRKTEILHLFHFGEFRKKERRKEKNRKEKGKERQRNRKKGEKKNQKRLIKLISSVCILKLTQNRRHLFIFWVCVESHLKRTSESLNHYETRVPRSQAPGRSLCRESQGSGGRWLGRAYEERRDNVQKSGAEQPVKRARDEKGRETERERRQVSR